VLREDLLAIDSARPSWSPPYEELEETDAMALLSLLRPFTATPNDGWFMLWDGYGDLGPEIDPLPRAMIHPDRTGTPLPPELKGGARSRSAITSCSEDPSTDCASGTGGEAKVRTTGGPPIGHGSS
jgi:hypothetical protein